MSVVPSRSLASIKDLVQERQATWITALKDLERMRHWVAFQNVVGCCRASPHIEIMHLLRSSQIEDKASTLVSKRVLGFFFVSALAGSGSRKGNRRWLQVVQGQESGSETLGSAKMKD